MEKLYTCDIAVSYVQLKCSLASSHSFLDVSPLLAASAFGGGCFDLLGRSRCTRGTICRRGCLICRTSSRSSAERSLEHQEALNCF